VKPIKVLHIIKSLGRGGAETLLPESLKLHDNEKFEFHYIYFLPWKDQMVSAIEAAGGIVTCLSASNNIRILFQAGRVIHYCQQNEIDLIHCHLPWAGFLGRYIHKKTGIPLIYTEHNLQERYHRITYTLNRLTFNHQSLALAVSDDVKQSILENVPAKIPVRTVLNGVNTEFYQRDAQAGKALRNSMNIPMGAVVIGTIAVFRFQKRLVEWLQVFPSNHQKNDNVYGILVGDGPLKDDILEERARLGLEEVVHMPGLQSEVKSYLSAMDIYMMTSSFEGLPIALLEAMSMECAIISTSAGGIREVIKDGRDGLLVSVDNWQQLDECANELIHNSERQSMLARSARERVSVAFSMKRMVAQLELIYQRILS